MEYEEFLSQKEIIDKPSGFLVELDQLNPMLFDWQKVLVRWAIMRGRAAIFADCGCGKGPMQLEWSKIISDKEQGPALILAPLAVAEQMVHEGRKFNIQVNLCRSQEDIKDGINVTNYEKLHKFNPEVFPCISCDESGILKSFSGSTRNAIIEAFNKTPYRLACTATPAPNDYTELGNHSEYLGVMTRSEMLATFFINDTANTGTWRLKGYVSDNIFWRWLSSWAVMMTKPSDLGFDDNGFILPNVHYHEHIIKTKGKAAKGFFHTQVSDLNSRRQVRRETMNERCNEAANIINSTDEGWLIWCGLNTEGELLTRLIDDAVEVAGRHSDDIKINRMMNFAKGEVKRLVSKPRIAGRGMNFQICHNAAFVGLSDSWEELYQAIRRIWRFGQKEEVNIHIFMEQREGPVLRNVKRKDEQARQMIKNMVKHTKELTKVELTKTRKQRDEYNPQINMEIPEWV